MNRRLIAMLLCWLTLAASGVFAQEASPSNPSEAAAVLVSRLGDDRFAVRERATSQLIALGVSARAALSTGLLSADREVRYRSRAVLAIIRDLDFQQRLQEFAADARPNSDYGLPGWQRFREVVGHDRAARTLFVEMYRAEPELLRVADEPPAQIGAALDQRCLELRQNVQLLGIRHSTDSVAALLFLVGGEGVPLNPPTNSTLYFLCQQGDVSRAARAGPLREAMHKMLARWLSREQNEPPRDAMMLGMHYEVRQVLSRARQLAVDPTVGAYDRQYAILAIAKFGGAAEIPLLEELLDDEIVCTEFRRRSVMVSVQMRDVALAALLHLAKQDFAEFDYPWLRYRQPYVFNPATLGFADQAQRQAALSKWQQRAKAERR